MNKMDLVLNNQQWRICHKTKPNQTNLHFPEVLQHLTSYRLEYCWNFVTNKTFQSLNCLQLTFQELSFRLVWFSGISTISCSNFWDEDWWFLSFRFFGLLASSVLLHSQRFGRYVLRSSSGVSCRTQEPCSDSVNHNRVLCIPVLLLAYDQYWTCNLQMIVSLEA